MKLNKKSCILAAVIVGLLCIGGIAAYLTDHATMQNTFTVGYNEVEIVEDFTPPPELKPGVSFQKEVAVSNTGPVDCFVRVLSLFSNSDMEAICDVNYNTTDWVYNETDQYWYYKHSLKAGETTKPLFDTVKIHDDVSEAEIKAFDIIVYTESYQDSGEFSNYQDAWDHFQINKPS